jgi:hypothetical protein
VRQLIGTCGVDSGMLMVGDPCYFIGDQTTIHARCKDWKTACKEVFCKGDVALNRDAPMDVYGLGVAIATTHGDGCYPVYLETTKSGKRRLVVELE